MSQLPAIQFASQAPILPSEMLADFGNMFSEAFNDLGSNVHRRLRPRKMDFLLVEGNNQEIIENSKLYAVLLGSASCNHAVWYEKSYALGQEPSAPDLVWKMPTPNTFPDALPKQFHQKIQRDGREVWAFQTLRRTVWSLARFNADGSLSLEIDRPFIFDISSMSLYGKSLAEQNMYKWSGIRDVCQKYSGNGVVVFPSMFITQIVLDTTVQVSGPVMFRPMRDVQTGHLQFLDANTIAAVHNAAQSQQVRDMVDVREKLTYENSTVQPVAQPVSSAPQMAQPAPSAPQAPAAPVAQPTPVHAPDSGMSDPRQLLANAQQLLNMQAQAAPVTPVSSPVTAPSAQPAPAAAPAPVPGTAQAGTTAATIAGLISQLS